MSPRRLIAVAAVGVALAAFAEVLGGDAPAGKSGTSPPVVLRLAVVQYAGKPAGRLAERYAREVAALTDGTVRIDVVHWPDRFAGGTASGAIESSAVRAIRSGDAELGLIPSHAFEAHGVTSLRGLQAPFVITSPALAVRATSGAVAERLQAGLEGISLVGLGLVPEGLQRPFGFLEPLLTPGDFTGVTIAADSSGTTRATLRLLGASPVDLHAAGVETAILSGFARGAASPQQSDDEFPASAYTTGNLAVFPEVDVVVASDATLDRLRPEQRAALRDAAARLRAAAAGITRQRAAAAAFCSGGGTIVRAPPTALPALRAAVRPLVADIGRDSTARALFAGLRSVSGGSLGVPPCASAPPEQPELTGPDASAAVALRMLPPVGSYRRAFSADELRAAGADATDVQRNAGITRLTVYGYDWRRFVIEWENSARRPCRGGLDLRGRTVRLLWNPATPCAGFVAFRWRRAGVGDVEIVSFDPRTRPAWLRRAYPGTWTRVDCRPHCGAAEEITAQEAGVILAHERGRFVACRRTASVAWDYECTEMNGFEPVGARFGIEVDAFGITRRSRATESTP
jgi:TRAP-type C4-dicarboxylate transport system substrate-binding protein